MSLASSTPYAQQLSEKVERLQTLLNTHNGTELTVYPSPESQYRMRAEFRVWHEGDDLYHIMFDQQTKEKYRVDALPAAAQNINEMMPRLLDALRNNRPLRTKLFQVDYLTALSGEMVISLLYHKPLDEEWEREAKALKVQLSDKSPVSIIGRARKQKRLIGSDFVIERLPVEGHEYVFKHIENSFTQPNAIVNCDMIQWTLDISRSLHGDLLELYCGAGNFSLPLAKHFNKVIGTEIAKPSVQAAQYNIEANQLNNVEIVRLSAEEFTDALVNGRAFNRLQNIDLTQYNFTTVLVDPPRAGLDLASLKMIQHYDNIIYISCNPETLHENLSVLCETHEITHTALFDQFPFTHHIEAGVCLKRK